MLRHSWRLAAPTGAGATDVSWSLPHLCGVRIRCEIAASQGVWLREALLSASKTQRTSCMTVLLFRRVVDGTSLATVKGPVHIWKALTRISRARAPPASVRPLRLHEMEIRRG